MYEAHFGLHEKPFSLLPDPRFLYAGRTHAMAMHMLEYGLAEQTGYVVLTGEVGTGKTTLVRSLLQRMPAEADVALVLNPQLTAAEFLTVILKELDVPLPQAADSCRALTEALNAYLLDAHSRGRRTIAVVDEAQNLSAEVLEQIRLLTNLETTRNKLLQIVLIGQPELRELLARNDLRQLAQRITARYHLLPLNAAESDRYIEHRLAVAGALQPVFTPRAKQRLFRLSDGIPRLMNLIADRSLLGAWSREQRQVDRKLVDAAAEEVFGTEPRPRPAQRRLPGAAVAAAVLVAAALVAAAAAIYLDGREPETTTLAGTPGERVTRPLQAPERDAAAPAAVDTDDPDEAAVTADAGATPVAAPPEPEPSLHDWLQAHRDRTGTEEAFDSLFAAWQLDHTDGAPHCAEAIDAGLRCAADQGALAELLLLDRPAIITLRDLDGEAHQVLLAAHRDGDVLLEARDASIVVPRAALDQFWFGEYLLLWKPAAGDATSFSPGMRGEGILWLRQSLTALSGDPIPITGNAERYDETLAGFVREFQRTRRLTVDGLVGQKTQMMINTELGVAGIPRLSDAWPVARSASNGGTG